MTLDEHEVDLEKRLIEEAAIIEHRKEIQHDKNERAELRKETEIRKEQIIAQERIRLKEDQLRKDTRAELREEAGLNKVSTIENRFVEKIEDIGKAESRQKTEALLKLASSTVHGGSLSMKERVALDSSQFEIKQKEALSEKKITDYIKKLFEIFDIEPYHQHKKTITDQKGTRVITELIPNPLPQFSRFRFEAGLTRDEMEQLRNKYERFNHAYEMCKEMQEYILVTNMTMGLYTSQPSIFTSKNLLGWRNEDKVDVSGQLNLGTLIKEIMDGNQETKLDDIKIT